MTSNAGVAPQMADLPSEDFIKGPWPVGLAWLAFVLMASGTARNVYQHLVNYSRPDLQQHVLRIVLVGPLYAFSAALCLSLEESGCFLVSSIRDIWEAVVVYSFLTLIIEYMGGEHLCLHSLSQRDEAMPHLFPLNLCLPPIPIGSMIRIPKIAALQFVVVKPVVVLMSIVVYVCGQFGDWYFQWGLFIVYNISYSSALYGLYLMYWALHEHPSLQSKKPLLKFLSVKMIVFLTFWQALILPHVPLPGSIGRWEDFILAWEMVFFGLLMNVAFSWQEFHSGLRDSRGQIGGCGSGPNKSLRLEGHTAKSMFEVDMDAAATLGKNAVADYPVKVTAGAAGRGSEVVQNAKAAFDPRDIIIDASANFSRRYQHHVLIESAQEYELRASDARSADLEMAGLDGATANVEDDQACTTGGSRRGALKTFRARTYLFGRSMGSSGGGGQPAPIAAPAACAAGNMGASKASKGLATNLPAGVQTAAHPSQPLPSPRTLGAVDALDMDDPATVQVPTSEWPPLDQQGAGAASDEP